MKKRSGESRLQDLGESIGRFERKEPADMPRKNGGAVGLQAGMQLVAGVLAGGAGGFFLDRWLGLTPLLMVTGLLLGAAAGMRALFKSAEVMATAAESETTNDGMEK